MRRLSVLVLSCLSLLVLSAPASASASQLYTYHLFLTNIQCNRGLVLGGVTPANDAARRSLRGHASDEVQVFHTNKRTVIVNQHHERVTLCDVKAMWRGMGVMGEVRVSVFAPRGEDVASVASTAAKKIFFHYPDDDPQIN